MKKGFTMIELLATIIVFTVVAMIGYNIVLTVIEKAKEQAFTRSVEFAMSSFDFARQYHKPEIETIEITSGDLKLEHNRFKSGTIILNDDGYAKALYATDGYYCATGLVGNMVVTKGDCVEDLTGPAATIESIPSLDKSELIIRVNATDSGLGLDPKAYSFDNGITWQTSNEVTVSSSYKNIIKVRDIVNNITTMDYNISKLTINANGGVITGLDEVSIYWLEDGETKNIPTPIKSGYSFTDWTKVGDSIVSGNSFTMGTEETSLTANYINATFTLQVNPNGGTWDGYTTTQSYSKIYGSTTTINNPTRANYTFNGWSVSGTNSIVSGTTFTMGSANASLTASWTINSYTLTINANGGSWSGTTPQTIASGSTVTIANPTRSSYSFAGWSVSGANSSISGTAFTMGSANTTLTANWVVTVTTFAYTGAATTYTAGASGTYKVELYGAQGGHGGQGLCSGGGGNSGGSGGYVSATIYMTKDQVFTVTVGGAGGNGAYSSSYGAGGVSGAGGGGGGADGGYHKTTSGAYNCGGCSYRNAGAAGGSGGAGGVGISGGGGGASDMRLNGTSLYDRIIVAGGGGGSGATSIGRQPGYGGGLNGANGWLSTTNGASQTGYGTSAYGNGQFGIGGTHCDDGGGGGGGWYGGGAGFEDNYGGGGSSYITGLISGTTIENYNAGNGVARIIYIGP